MKSMYLTPFKLEGSVLPPMSGTTVKFPNEFKGLITIENDLNESRKDKSLTKIKEIFDDKYKIKEKCIHFTLGASMAFFETLLWLKGKVEYVCFEDPFYEPYKSAAELLGFKIVNFNDAFFEKKKAAYCLSNPNFFKGTLLCDKQMDSLLNDFLFVVLDEVFYSSFSSTKNPMSKYKSNNLIKINSLSKSLGLSMLRFGWIEASEDIISEIKQISLLTFTDYPTPSLSVSSKVFEKFEEISTIIHSKYIENRKKIRNFILNNNQTIFSHDFSYGHFGAIKTNLNLSDFALSSEIFSKNEKIWRFRIDVDSDQMDLFITGISK